MSKACFFMYSNSATAFSAHTIFIFNTHDLLTEVAFIDVKVKTIHRYQLWQKYIFDLVVVFS